MDYAQIPKAELHCHLIGVIDRALLERVQGDGHRVLVAPDQVRAVSKDEGRDGFVRWLGDTSAYRSATWQDYLPILSAHIEALVAQNVSHAELTISPTMFPSALDAMIEAFASFHDTVRKIEAGRTQLEFLFVIPRALPEHLIEIDTQRCISLSRLGLLAGVSLAGMDDMAIDRFAPMLGRLKNAGLGIEIHAGEHSGPEEVAFALDSGFADRIGHGIGAFRDPGLLARLARDRVHLEFCLSSNRLTHAVPDLSLHPLPRALDLGIPFSINTDDPGPFSCTLTSEFELARNLFGLGEPEFAMIYSNTLAARFVPDRQAVSEPDRLQRKHVSARPVRL